MKCARIRKKTLKESKEKKTIITEDPKVKIRQATLLTIGKGIFLVTVLKPILNILAYLGESYKAQYNVKLQKKAFL